MRSGYITPAFLRANCLVRGGQKQARVRNGKKKTASRSLRVPTQTYFQLERLHVLHVRSTRTATTKGGVCIGSGPGAGAE